MSAGAVRQGRVYVEIGADARKLYAALGNINKRIGSIGQTMMAAGSQMMALGAGIATPILGAAAAFSQVGDAVQKMAARTGLSTEAVSALGFAAGQSGTDIETLEKGVRTMQRTLDDAANIGGRAAEAFQRLGVDVDTLRQMSPEQQFMALAGAIGSVADPGERAALAMQVFGRAGTALLPMFADGADGIQKLVDQANQLGIVMDQKTADSAARLNDSIGELQTSLKAIVVTVGAAVAPALSSLASQLGVAAGRVSRFVSENGQLVHQALAVGGAMFAVGGALTGAGLALKVLSAGLAMIAAPLVSTIQLAYKIVAGFAAATASVLAYTVKSVASAAMSAAAWAAANLPMMAAVAGAAALGAALFTVFDGMGLIKSAVAGVVDGVKSMASSFGTLKDIGVATVGEIMASIESGDMSGAMRVAMDGLKAAFTVGANAFLNAVDAWGVNLVNAFDFYISSIPFLRFLGNDRYEFSLFGSSQSATSPDQRADQRFADLRLSQERRRNQSAAIVDQFNAMIGGRRAVRQQSAATAAQSAQPDTFLADIDAVRGDADPFGDLMAGLDARRQREAALMAAQQQLRAEAASQAEVAGTFSAAAIGGMGFGSSLQQRMADYARRTAEATEAIADEGALAATE